MTKNRAFAKVCTDTLFREKEKGQAGKGNIYPCPVAVQCTKEDLVRLREGQFVFSEHILHILIT
jgi:hypothetical protein